MILSSFEKSDHVFDHIKKGFDVLSIGFAGFYDDNPRFDWNVLNKFDTDLLLIKDLKMAWYLCGIDGISSDVMETVEFIQQYTSKYKKLLFFGSSMGGFAALLYGSLVSHGNKTINSFGPQVNISPSAEVVNQWTVKAVNENVVPYIKEYDKKFSKITIDLTAQTGMSDNICDACGIAYCGYKETIKNDH